MTALPWRETLTKLVAFNTISSANVNVDMGNKPAAEYLADRLDGAGFDCVLQPLPERADKVNLIARLGTPQPGRGLVLSGHLDTVPFDETGWDSDPFTLTETDGRMYALGSCDMKGFLALAAEAGTDYADARLAEPLTLVATADEETGMDGARTLTAEYGALGRFCVIGEPTLLTPVRRHKGIFMETIETIGRTGHSSNPAAGANAIDAMRAAMDAIAAFRDDLAIGERQSGFPVEHATLNPGAIHGGDSANRIPARCRLDIDLRFLPGADIDALRTALRARVADAVAETDCSVAFTPLFDGTPAFATAADSELVQACERLSERSAAAVDFGTEGAFYTAAGVETVILGPGDIGVAHQPNEYLARAQIEPTQRILRGLIERFCQPG